MLTFQKDCIWPCWWMRRQQCGVVCSAILQHCSRSVCSAKEFAVPCICPDGVFGWRASSVARNSLLAAVFHSDLLWLGNESLSEKKQVVPSAVLQLEMVSGLDFSEWGCWYQFNLVHSWFISLGEMPALFSPGCLFLCCIYRQQHSSPSASILCDWNAKLFLSFPLWSGLSFLSSLQFQLLALEQRCPGRSPCPQGLMQMSSAADTGASPSCGIALSDTARGCCFLGFWCSTGHLWHLEWLIPLDPLCPTEFKFIIEIPMMDHILLCFEGSYWRCGSSPEGWAASAEPVLKPYRPNPADTSQGNCTLIDELFPRSVSRSKPGALAEALGTDVSGC